MSFSDRIDPELVAVLAVLPASDISDVGSVRSRLDEMKKLLPNGLADKVATRDVWIAGTAGDVRVRLYRPVNLTGPLPALLWIHGGGYVVGSADMFDERQSEMALAGNCLVASVDYRLAPEHPFPAPLEDCYSALKWLFSEGPAIDVDTSRVAIGGESAGGGLAAGLALLARDRAEVNIVFQLLISPMLDDRNCTPSSHAITESRVWNRQSNTAGWRAYLGNNYGSETISHHAVPARAVSLAGLPPAYIPVADMDLFLDENIEYTQRLLQAGVATELHIYTGGFHGFNALAPHAALSKRFNRDVDAALKRALSRSGQ